MVVVIYRKSVPLGEGKHPLNYWLFVTFIYFDVQIHNQTFEWSSGAPFELRTHVRYLFC